MKIVQFSSQSKYKGIIIRDYIAHYQKSIFRIEINYEYGGNIELLISLFEDYELYYKKHFSYTKSNEFDTLSHILMRCYVILLINSEKEKIMISKNHINRLFRDFPTISNLSINYLDYNKKYQKNILQSDCFEDCENIIKLTISNFEIQYVKERDFLMKNLSCLEELILIDFDIISFPDDFLINSQKTLKILNLYGGKNLNPEIPKFIRNLKNLKELRIQNCFSQEVKIEGENVFGKTMRSMKIILDGCMISKISEKSISYVDLDISLRNNLFDMKEVEFLFNRGRINNLDLSKNTNIKEPPNIHEKDYDLFELNLSDCGIDFESYREYFLTKYPYIYMLDLNFKTNYRLIYVLGGEIKLENEEDKERIRDIVYLKSCTHQGFTCHYFDDMDVNNNDHTSEGYLLMNNLNPNGYNIFICVGCFRDDRTQYFFKDDNWRIQGKYKYYYFYDPQDM